jgi:hypothetical protein
MITPNDQPSPSDALDTVPSLFPSELREPKRLRLDQTREGWGIRLNRYDEKSKTSNQTSEKRKGNLNERTRPTKGQMMTINRTLTSVVTNPLQPPTCLKDRTRDGRTNKRTKRTKHHYRSNPPPHIAHLTHFVQRHVE